MRIEPIDWCVYTVYVILALFFASFLYGVYAYYF